MDLIQKYFSDLNREQVDQFSALSSLYYEWNNKVNVISRKDIDNLYERHVLHSLAIAKFISFKDGTTVLDFGTGGGFPGIPLAIMFPKVKFTLVDSIGKKINVVNSVSSALGLANVQTYNGRIEEINGQYEFFVSRAVTKLDTAWGWIGNKIDSHDNNELKNGLIYLKGGDIEAEKPNKTIVQQYPVKQWFNEPFFNDKGLVYITKQ
jgi:16S rRNA (guanine527-N7)-methyltransferase